MATVKILLAGRLSQSHDKSTSLERQETKGRTWARGQEDARVVGWVADDGVSGSVSPFDRDALGPWLTDNPPKPFDVLAATKLDRIGRSARDILELAEWLSRRGKRLVFIDDKIDTDGPFGKFFLTVMAAIAELERALIMERTRDARAKLVADGYWIGGQVAWGYKVIPDGPHKRVVVDEDVRDLVVQAFEWAADGRNPAWISRELQRLGVDTPRGGEAWSRKTVAVLLERDLYIGLGDVPAIVDPDLFARAGKKLSAAKHGRAARATSGHWAGTVFCAECGGKLWSRNEKRRGRVYYCQHKHGKDIREDLLDDVAKAEFISAFGKEPVVDIIVHPDTTASEVALCRAKLDRVNERLRTADGPDRAAIRTERDAIETELDELESRPPREGRTERIPTGETWEQRADRMDAPELADEIQQRGFTFGVRLLSIKPLDLEISVTEHSPVPAPEAVAYLEQQSD
ncbi:recombinase family protein [Amycolatopsis orientalis]|uniref:recombinase family protein n=1 Tax=Amycolatopsis orientalis TaxID=31958 RepID=UPI001319E8E6|nr:recombinase family protein [Amycolatopsis orientalis]